MDNNLTIGDYVTLIRGITYKGNLVGKPGPALLGLGSIQPGGGFRNSDYKTYGGECPSKIMLFPGDLYVSLKGATKDGEMIGSVARVPKTVSSGRLTQDTVKLDFKRPDPKTESFLYWVLRTPQYRDYCAGRATGSAVVALSREDFLSYPVPKMTHERMCIVEILEEIEKKIELNRQMSRTLKRLARAIFRAWFVDFEPVKAKAINARSFPGMPPKAFNALPTRFIDSELGPIPKGWGIESIGNAVSVYGGGTPSTKIDEYWRHGLHYWLTPKDLSGMKDPILLSTERRITDKGLDQISSGLLPIGTVLLSSRAPVGYLVLSAVPTAINQGFIAMVCDGPLPPLYVFHWTQSVMDVIKSRASGTTFPEISKTAFRPIMVCVPPKPILNSFVTVVAPLFDRLTESIKESRLLATMRDYLLPKILSGDVAATGVDDGK